MLGAAALVGGNDVFVAIVSLDGLFQMIEIATAGIGLVAQHHACPLAVAHGAGAAIGQQIDVNILRAQEEGVVSRLGHRSLPLLGRRHVDRLHHFDLPRFSPGTPPELLAHGLRKHVSLFHCKTPRDIGFGEWN